MHAQPTANNFKAILRAAGTVQKKKDIIGVEKLTCRTLAEGLEHLLGEVLVWRTLTRFTLCKQAE